MKKILFLCLLVFCPLVFAQDVITSFDQKDVPVLNEELKKIQTQVTTIASTTTPSTFNGAGFTNLGGIPVGAGTIPAANLGSVGLGSWVSKSAGTVFQSSTDGNVVVQARSSSGQQYGLDGYTDGNNPPTTLRNSAFMGIGDTPGGMAFPVRKNDYWEVIRNATWGTGTVNIYWLPSGT